MYNLKEKELIFVFTGPDGSGRKTIADLAARTTLNIAKVVSYTTRERKNFEIEGKDYYYISREEFQKAKENGEFLESVEIDGNFYGIKEADIEKTFDKKRCIYLVLNNEGAKILKDLYGNKVIQFFISADRETVITRQKERGDSKMDIERHLSHYDESMEYKQKCEHSFENYELSHVLFEVVKAIESEFKK